MVKSLVGYQVIDFLGRRQLYFNGSICLFEKAFWLENINDGTTAGVGLLDISKSFDSINHTIVSKIEIYGITSTELQWCSSYLKRT